MKKQVRAPNLANFFMVISSMATWKFTRGPYAELGGISRLMPLTLHSQGRGEGEGHQSRYSSQFGVRSTREFPRSHGGNDHEKVSKVGRSNLLFHVGSFLWLFLPRGNF